MRDEPFEQWARRREDERDRKKGRLRLNTLNAGPERGSHVDPETPRLISRWDGYVWEPVAVACNWETAMSVLKPSNGAAERRAQPASARSPGQDVEAQSGGITERKRVRLRNLL
ncbi:DUF6087 family protein [Streptomyces sp. NPDC101225]|uniref:DUF6087 family protein n=1 Tax=Streptomyces sp. NPDC101225 TaxID=3366135 RepID=UPI00380CB496